MITTTNTPFTDFSNSSNENPDGECSVFIFIIYVPVLGLICFFGIAGNTLSLIVLGWERRNRVATLILQALALADNMFLLTAGFSQMFVSLTIYYELPIYEVALPYIQVFIWPLVHITQFWTIYTTVLIAANRYIAICRPFQAYKLCKMSKVRIQLISILLIAIIYNIPRFFEYQLGATRKTTPMKDSKHYQIIYDIAAYYIFVFLGPLSILIILNVCLIKELVNSRKRLTIQAIKMPGEEEEQNLTLVMIVIILAFVIFQTPALINQLLDYVLDETAYSCHKPYYYYYHISNILVTLNSASNFIVYCVFREQFRERLRNLLKKHRSLGLKYIRYSTQENNPLNKFKEETATNL